jgi:Zn-dependent M28 family amino/carboxypeptidase
VVLLVPDSADFRLFARSRGEARYFADGAVDDPIWQPDLPMLIGGPAVTAALLVGVDLPRAAFGSDPMTAVDLGRSVAATIRTRQMPISAANIAGVLPGSDPERRDEFVVFTAHYDHLGVGEPDTTGDSIYNGFSDNAAGVAMLLAIAATLRDAPPPRSIAFVFLTGEERGLLGSSWLAAHSPIPLERIAAVINLDAGAPPVPPVSWRIAGGAGTHLGAVASEVGAGHGWTIDLSAASPNSDYWPFLARAVPSIFIIPGNEWESTTPAERDSLRQKWDHYHQADDEWHEDFPLSGLARYALFAMEIGLEVASEPAGATSRKRR